MKYKLVIGTVYVLESRGISETQRGILVYTLSKKNSSCALINFSADSTYTQEIVLYNMSLP